jgi:hypothetical protein
MLWDVVNGVTGFAVNVIELSAAYELVFRDAVVPAESVHALIGNDPPGEKSKYCMPVAAPIADFVSKGPVRVPRAVFPFVVADTFELDVRAAVSPAVPLLFHCMTRPFESTDIVELS